MNKDQCFQFGYISKVHGLHGEVVIVLDVDYPEEYENIQHLFIEQKSRLIPFFLEHFVPQPGNKVLAKFEDFDRVEDVSTLVGAELFLPLTELPKLEDDQYFFHELVGFEVIDIAKGPIGRVEQIYDLQTQDLLGVTYLNKEILIPIQDGIIQKVDKTEKKVHCQLPEGLIDIYLED